MNIRKYYRLFPYMVKTGMNGKKYVTLDSVRDDCINMSFQNSKTGKVIAFNLPIELTCDHKVGCYKEKACYACSGCYQFTLNQAIYSENLKYFKNHTAAEFIEKICEQIAKHPSRKLFRWFTCGDIVNPVFLYCMCEIARRNPHIKFWTYTKKYGIVNSYVKQNGIDSIPENLVIVFSHWMNDDGTYYPMYNPYSFPTSEFIPMGKEEMLDNVTNICPCSNPAVFENCASCSHPCYELKHGESMGLVEHSTSRTKTRDAAIKAAHTAKKAMGDFNLVDFLKSFIGV